MATAEELLVDACADDIADLSQTQLWVVIAEALAQQVSMTAEELLDAACEDGISSLSETQLLIAIAEGINQGGGGGGGGSDQIKNYVADPNTEGVVPGDLTKGAICYPTVAGAGPNYVWDVGDQNWQ